MTLPAGLVAAACLGLCCLPRPGLAAETGGPMAVTVAASPSFARGTDGAGRRSLKCFKAGIDALNRGLFDRAALDFSESASLDPEAGTYRELGEAYDRAGKIRKAAWAYRESLRLSPDPQVQALAAALVASEAKDSRTRYRLLVSRASVEAETGEAEASLQDGLDAFALQAGVESALPCLQVAASTVEQDLDRGALAEAVEVLCRTRALRDYLVSAHGDQALLARLDRLEDRAVRWSGASLAGNRKFMLADRDAWLGAMRNRAALGERGR